jgi:hypothetical protein
MQLNRFGGLRRRLSYANVMATLAFFFALTGGAMAATKYLGASDPIPATSDLTGTYGNPLIADGKVTSTKIADGAITSSKFDSSATAPNSEKLDGLDSTAFPRKIASGAITLPAQSLPPGGCSDISFVSAPGALETDNVVVNTPGRTSGGLDLEGGVFLDEVTLQPLVGVGVCNVTSSTQASGGTYRYLVLR